MQIEIPQIFWHESSGRILSCDVYPNSNIIVTSSLYSSEDTGIRVRPNFLIMTLVMGTDLRATAIDCKRGEDSWKPRLQVNLSGYSHCCSEGQSGT